MSVAFLMIKCKTVNVLYVGTGKYLYSTVNLVVAKAICTTSELYVTDTKEYLLFSSIMFTQLKSEFAYLYLVKFLCKFDHFPRGYRRKQKWMFLYGNTLYTRGSVTCTTTPKYRDIASPLPNFYRCEKCDVGPHRSTTLNLEPLSFRNRVLYLNYF